MNSRLMSFPLALLALAVLASGAGAQCEIDKLTVSDAAAGDWFGGSVRSGGSVRRSPRASWIRRSQCSERQCLGSRAL